MPYRLKGRNVLVTGGSRGLGALLCEKFAAEGCNVVVNYVSSEDSARQVAEACEKHGSKAVTIKADAGTAEDNTRLIKESVEALGGLDIIVANAGWTKFTTFGDLNAMTTEEWNKCWAVNVMAHVQLMQQAAPIFNANPDGGVYLISSSVAGIYPGGSSMPYATTKAAGLHLVKCLAATQGPKIRVNAILPGLLLTEWGLKYSEEAMANIKERAALKDVTNLEDCADMYISAAKNSSMTGQRIAVDAGLVIQ